MNTPHFTRDTITYLEELKEHNDREWFQRHKDQYERHIKAPFLRFIGDFAAPLEEISRHFIADPRPNGGSLFRIYRDVRFSKDKSPYKTNAGAHFKHEQARNVHAPGFYLHVEPGGVFGAAGIWRPDSKALKKVREFIVKHPERWSSIISNDAIAGDYFRMAGESLKRGPKDFDPDHPLIDDLKRKDFILVHDFSEEELCRPDFIEAFADLGHRAAPFVAFICDSLDVPF